MPRSGKFKMQAPFPPKGDQPAAIAELVEGARDGLAHQVLLGATGTGKSVAPHEPVTVFRPDGTIYRGPIGELIDPVFGQTQEFETLEARAPRGWEVFAYDASTGRCERRIITALSRHRAPDRMFYLQTSCGREVEITGDHSVWVLRDGRTQLLPGGEVRTGDCLPVPLQTPAPDVPVRSFDALQFATTARGAWHVRFDAVQLTFNPHWRDALREETDGNAKASRMRRSGEGIEPRLARDILTASPALVARATIGSRRHQTPVQWAISPAMMFVWGQFLAEGHAAEQFALISTRDPEVQRVLEADLRSIGAPFGRRSDGDFTIPSRVWRDIFAGLMGTHAGGKHLPALWPQLGDEDLGALLRGYFEGDGGLEKGAVTALTLSATLSADLTEALLRFGIWARRRLKFKRKPNGEIGKYWKVTIAGADNLRAFSDNIGFVSSAKKTALQGALKTANTNVDLVFGVGPRLLAQREKRGFLQRDVSGRAGCCRSMISAIETGIRAPSRALFQKICAALQIEDETFTGLAGVHWSPIADIQKIEPAYPFVYDFSVDGYETFLTGRGGVFVHNTFTASSVIQELQRPALIIAHNKTLAAQLCQEIREFFPDNAVEYFVSYYDYYQPEAYVPHSDTFIEKESSRNDEIDRLRHSSTQSLTSRRDVIVVSSVSCIYGLGTPELYKNFSLDLRVGDTIDRRGTLERLVAMQFARNDVNLVRGTFRVRGDVLEVHPRDSDNIVRVDTFGDEIESIQLVNSVTQNVVEKRTFTTIFPATHFIADEDRMEGALIQIEHDLDVQSAHLESQGKLLEAQRLRQRVRYDMEMMREVGYCNGIENYSRYLDGRKPGDPPYTLIDYFPDDFLLMIDESHQTIPQIRAMYNGDRARKETLVDYGFRLPSAFDNRPLRFEEFEQRMPQTTYVSATPGPYELEHIGLERIKDEAGNAVTNKGSALGSFVMPPDGFPGLAQQIIRPTGLLDPEIFVRPSRGQIDDLLGEIRARTAVGQRVLATTLTKRMAEDLTDYLKEIDVKVNYLHSDIQTMERSQILRELRQGKYDVVVGINLLREGLDLPEVSLVAILDADKEGFLRSETSLIQTIGRAARHVNGQVVMYADRVTGSMQRAIDETNRRRALQIQYNEANGITPQGIQKAIREDLITELLADVQAEMQPGKLSKKPKMEDLPKLLEDLEAEMKAAAGALDFERAAQLRDELLTLRELAKG